MDDHKLLKEDELTRQIIQQSGRQEPSWDFTSKVMNSILSAKASDVYTYKPVISKSGWIGIFVSAGLFILLISYFQNTSPGSSPTELPYHLPYDMVSDKIFKSITSPSIELPSLQGFTGVLAACWLLFGLDKIFKRQRSVS